MVKNLSPREFDQDQRQPQLTLVSSKPSGQSPDERPDTIGSVLHRARLARGGQSLEDIANDIRIRPNLLRALEEDNYAELPSGVYASGFLKIYAEYLGLDPAPLLDRLKNSGASPVKEAPLHFPEPINDPRIPRRPLVFLAVVLCAAVYGTWVILSGSDDDLNTVPQPTRDIAELATPSEPAAPVATPTPAPPPPPSSEGQNVAAVEAPAAPAPLAPVVAPQSVDGQMVLIATEETWIRVTSADQRVFAERILKPGESLAVPADAGYRLLAGNAGGVQIDVAGRKYGPLGGSGQVTRNFALEGAHISTALPALPQTRP